MHRGVRMKGIEREIARLQMKNMTCLQILEMVADEFLMSVSDIRGRQNLARIVHARRTAIRRMGSVGYDPYQIAQVMERDVGHISRIIKEEGPFEGHETRTPRN